IPVPSLALVGYTNAGKSTLFGALTGADAYVADQLFATLDPTVRRITLPGGTAVVAADTVGFIRELPHELVAAFQSTLTEPRPATGALRATRAPAGRRGRWGAALAPLRRAGGARGGVRRGWLDRAGGGASGPGAPAAGPHGRRVDSRGAGGGHALCPRDGLPTI